MEYKKIEAQINDFVGDNVKKLAQLFPSAVKDGQVDFQALKEELGQFEEVGSEKYELTWAGKQNAKKIAQEDVYGKTLKFIPEESVNADTTENLYIEGDNLEVLKLLRQNYYGAIKMIYIDPPYNTGKDFVYNDNFAMTEKESRVAEGYQSEIGERYKINCKSQNRYHANWMNMMYPRLKIAKDILSEEGFIFISIGEEELENMMIICNEIFDANNFRNIISTRRYDKNLNLQFVDAGLSTLNVGLEYILVYSKSPFSKMSAVYKESTNDRAQKGYWKGFWNNADRPTMRYELLGYLPKEGQWKWKKEVAVEAMNNYIEYTRDYSSKMTLEEYWIETGKNKRFIRRNPSGIGKNMGVEHWVAPSSGILRNSNWSDMLISKPSGVDIPFDSPKNPDLIIELCKLCNCKEDIILDFFSGSASTAHAVLRYNAEFSLKNKFIMIQLPECIDEKTEAYKCGFDSIAKLGRERIRRVGEKIKEEYQEIEIDVGFKSFRVEKSNIKWNTLLNKGQIDLRQLQTTPDLIDFMPEANDINIVYELMLRQQNLSLSEPLEKLIGIGTRTYLYAKSYLICLDTAITKDLVDILATLNPLPIKFIFRDSAFGDDIALKDETFRRLKALIEKNSGTSKKAYTVEFI